jgi:hypothetical protein
MGAAAVLGPTSYIFEELVIELTTLCRTTELADRIRDGSGILWTACGLVLVRHFYSFTDSEMRQGFLLVPTLMHDPSSTYRAPLRTLKGRWTLDEIREVGTILPPSVLTT